MQFISDDGGKTYNRCHCKCSCFMTIKAFYSLRDRRTRRTHLTLVWSNFEIGDLDFWRGEAYMKYFTHLDEAGGFYNEVGRLHLHTGEYCFG